MLRHHRWLQRFAAGFDQLGRRLGGGPAVGVHGAFVALPFASHSGGPEHTVDTVDREASDGDRDENERR